MPLGIGLEPGADRGQGLALADAGQHILQRPTLGRVIQHVANRHQRHIMESVASRAMAAMWR
jgi:hypothetical protein